MSKVTLELFYPFSSHPDEKKKRGSLSIEVGIDAGETVETILHKVAADNAELVNRFYDIKLGTIKDGAFVAVGGSVLDTPDELRTPLNDGDRISVIPLIGGG